MKIDRVEISGSPSGYQLNAAACKNVTLQPGQRCNVTVMATPAAIMKRASIHIEVFVVP